MIRLTRERLVGTWRSDPADSLGKRTIGTVTMKFFLDGTLHYTIHEPHADQVVLLRYWINDHWLMTDQPSAPGVERTRFELVDDNLLILEHDNLPARFIRQGEPSSGL